jgi:hypothetical protein
MALGELTKCWVCWETEAYNQKNPNLKQLCSPYRAKKGTICEGMLAWICSNCRKEIAK